MGHSVLHSKGKLVYFGGGSLFKHSIKKRECFNDILTYSTYGN